MTREERENAIKVIKNYDLNFHKINGILFKAEEIANAFDCALEALKQEPKIGWIPCSEKMPDEHEWLGTTRFGTTISDEVYVTFENPKGERFTRHLSFQNGKLSISDQHTIDAFFKGSVPIAWMPLPEPYKMSEKPTGSESEG